MTLFPFRTCTYYLLLFRIIWNILFLLRSHCPHFANHFATQFATYVASVQALLLVTVFSREKFLHSRIHAIRIYHVRNEEIMSTEACLVNNTLESHQHSANITL